MAATVIIEVLNILNLVTIDVFMDVIMNFLALGVLSDFDDMFLTPFLKPELAPFSGLEIPKKRYLHSRVVITERFAIAKSLYKEKQERILSFTKRVGKPYTLVDAQGNKTMKSIVVENDEWGAIDDDSYSSSEEQAKLPQRIPDQPSTGDKVKEAEGPEIELADRSGDKSERKELTPMTNN